MDTTKTITTKSPRETQTYGQNFGHCLITGDRSLFPWPCSRILCLYGLLGSGKTTFIQGVGNGIGVITRLLSPTFIIVRRYTVRGNFSFFYHIDAYRLEQQKQVDVLGFQEIFADPSAIVCIEWADKIAGLLPKERLDLYFETRSEHEHTIRLDVSSNNRKYGAT